MAAHAHYFKRFKLQTKIRMFKTFLFLAAVLVCLSGCSTTKVVNPDGARLKLVPRTERISVSIFESAPLRTLTPGDAVGVGLIDDLTRPDNKDLRLPTPSALIASKLRDRLSAALPLQIEEAPTVLSVVRKTDETYVPGSHTLEIYTDVSFLGYRPLAWETYQYMLIAHALLMDPEGVVLWQNGCQVGGASEDKSLQLDRAEFKNNESQRLKDILRLASDRCAESLIEAIIGQKKS